jgi:putative ABC transport system permease protein
LGWYGLILLLATDLDRLNEIYHTLLKNPLRTALTAFGVGWGVFMLMVVLGSGKGLENGVRSMFAGFATNSVFFWGQSTSIAYQGLPKVRPMQFENDDIPYLKREVPGIDILAPRNQLGGFMGGNNVVYKDKTGAFSVTGDYPEIMSVNQVFIDTGRFINQEDIRSNRKVAVVGKRVAEVLIGDKNPLQEYIQINGVYFQIVGRFHTKKSGSEAERDEQTIYIPFTTFQKAFNKGKSIGWFAITCKPGVKGSQVEADMRKALNRKYRVAPEDDRAFGSFNVEERFASMENTFTAVRLVSWFVGLMTLFAGVIGVSNIMLITVKERTREIGIRRAIGASPWAIMTQIVLESIALTLISGYLGMVSGIWLLEGLNKLGIAGNFFKNPEVSINVAVTSLFILVVSGALAGILPARRAISIKPVDALRYE